MGIFSFLRKRFGGSSGYGGWGSGGWGGHGTGGGVGLGFLFMAAVIHFFDAFIRLPGGRVDFYVWSMFFIFYAFLAVLGAQRIGTWRGPLIASGLAAFVIPFLYTFVARTSIVMGMFMLLMPTWIIYLLLFRPEFPRLNLAYMMFWIVLLTFSVMPSIQTYAGQQGYDLPTVSPALVLRYTGAKLYAGGLNAWHAITVTAPEVLSEEAKRSMAIFRGDYYTGSVDQSADKKLGVYLEGLRPAQAEFYEKEPVTVFANLKAETLSRPIDIVLTCELEQGNVKAKSILPKNAFMVETFEDTSIDCIFDSLNAGRYTAKLTADFTFSTRSYQKVYLMDKERLRDYRRRNADPLEGFPDKAPTTIYSPGPLMMGMGMGTQPLGILEGESGPTIGVTFDNVWAGKLKEITDLIIYTPKGLTVNDINGIKVDTLSCDMLPDEEKTACDSNIESVYRLPEAEFAKLKELAKQKEVIIYTFRAHTNITDQAALLGDTPVSIKSIKVSVFYKYTYSSSVGFSVVSARI